MRSASGRLPIPRRSRRASAALRRVVGGRAGLSQASRPAKTPGDLAAHDVIAFVGIDGIERWRFRAGIEAPIKPRLIVNTAEAAIDAAVSGFGITRVLSYQAVDALAGKTLVRLLREHEGEETPIHVLYPDGRHPPPKLRAFLDALVPRLRQRCAAVARAIER